MARSGGPDEDNRLQAPSATRCDGAGEAAHPNLQVPVQDAGYTIQRCTRAAQADDQVHLVAIVTGPDPVPGDAISAVIANDGVTMPTPAQGRDHLSRFVGVILGGEMGMDPSVWLVKNLGMESEQTTAGDLVVTTTARTTTLEPGSSWRWPTRGSWTQPRRDPGLPASSPVTVPGVSRVALGWRPRE